MLCAGPIVCGHASPRRGAGAHGATRACRNCDVAIVGAGPAGLSAAIAIRQALPGVSVEVFEKAARFQPAGEAAAARTIPASSSVDLASWGPRTAGPITPTCARGARRRNG